MALVLWNVRRWMWRTVGGQVLSVLEVVYFSAAMALLGVLLSQHVGFVKGDGCMTVVRDAVGKLSREDLDIVELKVEGQLSRMRSKLSVSSLSLDHAVRNESDVLFRFSRERGLLLVPRSLAKKHNMGFAEVVIDSRDPCLGSFFSRSVIEHVVGYEVLLLNTFQKLVNQDEVDGFLYSFFNRKLYLMEPQPVLSRWMNFRSKFAAMLTSIFIMYTTSGLVTFALRHVQVRILKLSMDLRAYMLSHPSCSVMDVIIRYSIDAIVFVPIVTGILFFLREFFEDLLLTFMIVLIAWLREVVVLLNARNWSSGRQLPRLLSAYCLCFHLYFFCFPLGYNWLALFTCVLFMQHAVISIWNRSNRQSSHAELIMQSRHPFYL